MLKDLALNLKQPQKTQLKIFKLMLFSLFVLFSLSKPSQAQGDADNQLKQTEAQGEVAATNTTLLCEGALSAASTNTDGTRPFSNSLSRNVIPGDGVVVGSQVLLDSPTGNQTTNSGSGVSFGSEGAGGAWSSAF